jgi:hypothetical protein
MQETSRNRMGVIQILDRARCFDNEVGKYKRHFLNVEGDYYYYSVMLDDNKIVQMNVEMAEDQENNVGGVSDKAIESWTNRYWEKDIVVLPEPIERVPVSQKNNFWQRILKLIGLK